MHVVQTRASDADLPSLFDEKDIRRLRQHHLRYSIVSGDPAGDFSIGDRDGLVVVARGLDYERRNTYRSGILRPTIAYWWHGLVFNYTVHLKISGIWIRGIFGLGGKFSRKDFYAVNYFGL